MTLHRKRLKKKFADEVVRNVLPKGISADQVEIYFEDEARVGQQGTLTRIWTKKGTRTRLKKQGQFLYAYIWGFVCPQNDSGFSFIFPSCDTDIMNELLKELSKVVTPGKHAVLVLDNAAWHRSKGIKLPTNISVLPLPPYSPELNPVEQIWEQLRQQSLANREFADYEAIVDACSDAWNKFTEVAGAIKKLCSRSWATVKA
jgi:putative transposase